MKNNIRATAAEIVFSVIEEKQLLTDLIKKNCADMAEKDIKLVKNISYGIIRKLPELEAIVTQQLNAKIKPKNKILYYLLLVGCYQIKFTRIPVYASIHATVSACSKFKITSAKSLVNAVLRKISKQNTEITKNTEGFSKPQFHHKHFLCGL